MFTLFLLEGGGPRSAMLPGYLLLIAGTALRLRLGLVWFVSGLCVLSYIGLLVEAAWRRPELQAEPTAVINFVLSLAVVGLIQVLLLRRLKTALAREP